jgi:hypothetical protein
MDVQGKSQNPSLVLVPNDRSLQQYPSNFGCEVLAAFESSAPASIFSLPASPAFGLSSDMHSSNVGTVQSLFMNEPFISAPSIAGTSLTVPSTYKELPELIDSCEATLNFSANNFQGSDNWFSLVPDQNVVVAVPSAPAVDESPATKLDDFETAEKPAKRRKSRESKSPSGRHSSVSGVGSRCRHKSLPAIIVEDTNDAVAMKRARNTLAARKCRERRATRFEELEEKIRKLEANRDHWKQVAIAHGATQ